MRNILIRSGISPLDTFDAAEMIINNSIGGNVGNLIYAYSVYRNLMTENTNIIPDYYNTDPSPKRAAEINEKYDAYVIPLADAFRPSFVPTLKRYTKLIKQLKIPVYVVGVGLRAPFEPDIDEGFPFDEDVKEFIKAVLEKSSIVGLRGEITSKYLTKLGFREGVDHTVIGCPSMYTFGPNLKIRDTNITKDSLVCVNSSLHSPKNVLDFITRGMEAFPNYYFIPQWLKEMRLVYTGSPSIKQDDTNYPAKITSPAYKENRVRYFLNAPTWIDFMKKADLSFGARLHGNITATIAGTPSLIIPKDARMRELAEYHNLTSIWWNDIKDDTRIENVIEKVDFKSPEKVQKENFEHFISFLDQNGIDHIYKGNSNPEIIPLEEKLSKVKLRPPIKPITGCTFEETVERWEKFYSLEEERINKYKERIKKYKNEISVKNRRIKSLEGTLNRKSVRLALKTANLFQVK